MSRTTDDTKCPACQGKPMLAYGYNSHTGHYTIPEACAHVCPTRAEGGDYELCYCCRACMTSGYGCGERERPAA